MVRGRKNPLHFGLALRLRRARRAAGLSCAALSRRAGLGPYTVAAIEAGDRLPRLPAAVALALALGMPAGQLVYGLADQVGEPDPAGLRARVQQLRRERGLSARAVARAAELEEGTIRGIERGAMPTVDTVEQVAVACGVSSAWLAYGTGPRELPKRGAKTAPAGPVISP